ncbi:tyrosine-type recombinase/integrase, partial [Campylobacter sp. 7477a]|uniref:tyrosine-type recombinase/integrase n=1 Tax=Campylobacter sp. 7477a TaxID=2735741 RepID=UPI0030156AC4|nr:tyrosine-type recombinase/integrase [Campylobacter sp. 7477a]
GARICEILALEWDDINFEKKSISIAKSLSRGFVKNRTKTGVDREIPLFDQVLPYLKELEKTRDSKWLFSHKKEHL